MAQSTVIYYFLQRGASMGAAGAEIIGGAAGAALGSLVGGGGGGMRLNSPFQVMDDMNNLLNKALQTSTQQIQQGGTQAQSALSNAQSQANTAINTGLNNANQQTTNSLNNGLNQYMALNAPAARAGYNALDALNTSLGFASSVPRGGSYNLAQALFAQQNAQNAQNAYQQQYNTNAAPTAPTGTAPTAPTLDSLKQAVTQQQINDYLQKNTNWVGRKQVYQGVGHDINGNLIQLKDIIGNTTNSTPIGKQIVDTLANQQLTQAQADYQNNLNNYNQQQSNYVTQNEAYQNMQNAVNQMSPDQHIVIDALNNGSLFGGK